MRKCFCDACTVEISGSPNNVEVLIHIFDIVSKNYRDGYVDNDGNRVSGRYKKVELCNKCYNVVMCATVKTLQEIQDKYDVMNEEIL